MSVCLHPTFFHAFFCRTQALSHLSRPYVNYFIFFLSFESASGATSNLMVKKKTKKKTLQIGYAATLPSLVCGKWRLQTNMCAKWPLVGHALETSPWVLDSVRSPRQAVWGCLMASTLGWTKTINAPHIETTRDQRRRTHRSSRIVGPFGSHELLLDNREYGNWYLIPA